ncbi:MAG: NADH-quinone oxidoreductase subunit L [Chloroflexota bacterium]|nr:NADH-quinone oxidoreductase subunit L [Chloroflexota bacterium]
MEDYIWVIPLAPLVAFLINFLFGKRLSGNGTAIIGIISVLISLVLSILVFTQVLGAGGEEALNFDLYEWIASGDFRVGIGFYVDRLAAIMLLVVTSVSLLVHIYSIGYMHGDPGQYRFFAYLPLFTFSMLMLVLSNNFLELYVFWEAVGLCSYLLIGFWYYKKSASDAAMKAFIVNRVGDFGFGLGVILLFLTFGTLAYEPIFERAGEGEIAGSALTLITLLLFTGSMGKSAQWPLHTWLPDAMEGPTPVSALIHAATMVTAGVYLVARANPLYDAAPGTLTVVAVIGVVTALIGATIGLVQNDIKRVMAYSTISQLGFMFFALGIGAYVSAIFHLFTHAFFKALLFLGAGSVMHGVGGETDMRRMGGLRKYMPQTFWTLTIGSLALAGVPPLAGFWSKDEILGLAFVEGHYVIWALGTLASFFTAFYITRLIALTFLGEPRFDTHQIHPHESPATMTVPLWILAILSIVTGLALGIPPEAGPIHSFLEPVFAHHEVGGVAGEAQHAGGFTPMTIALMLTATAVSLLGIALAYLMYVRRLPALDPQVLAGRFAGVYKMLYNKYYFDEIYNALIVRPSRALGDGLWRFDARVVDGAVNGVAEGVSDTSGALRRAQTGFVGNYALAIGVGLVGLLAAIAFL